MSAGERSAVGRRELTYAVLLCLAGAGLALWAATRNWSVELTVRPAPLPPVRDTRSGAGLLPWLPALALVTLAGGGAVLATRGRLRRVLGVLLGALGLAVAAGGGYGLVADVGGSVSRQWPALCLVGGLLAAAGGLWTALRGGDWPAMGARYERPMRTAPETASTPAGPAVSPTPMAGRRTTEAWEALDRGEDPTAD
ncbi:Trp biosynthesis-associated membrane protein [Micromonospora sp. LH3U1]|uniref:Trp biosynthesis-associated membrane protein n=1 Tax=Micromonospora sp. LH3U1 TaxID=3018339 RepID=UPI002349ADA3|nr:Trp biosynthesis-associated membrane protein [Micromonospora sp. LH3U1]WCN79934.1 Trp biosynthesis-associated membrane protein [Micromonospora sp. LH3U1]